MQLSTGAFHPAGWRCSSDIAGAIIMRCSLASLARKSYSSHPTAGVADGSNDCLNDTIPEIGIRSRGAFDTPRKGPKVRTNNASSQAFAFGPVRAVWTMASASECLSQAANSSVAQFGSGSAWSSSSATISPAASATPVARAARTSCCGIDT